MVEGVNEQQPLPVAKLEVKHLPHSQTKGQDVAGNWVILRPVNVHQPDDPLTPVALARCLRERIRVELSEPFHRNLSP